MLNNTIERLRAMKMNAFASELERQIEDSESYNQLGFEDRLALLVDSEWNRRQDNKLIRFIRNARFSDASATIEGIEYIEDRHLDKGKMLRFATCNYIENCRHIILKGASGNGKTYIACALGNAACRKFKTVRYIRMPELLDELNIARINGEFSKVINAYKKVDLLILDEWLIRKLNANESYDLLEIIESRIEKSMIFCTQYHSEGWYNRINPDPDNDSPISDAIIEIDGETWHNPSKVSQDKYADDLLKQNSMVYQGWRVFRWTDTQLTKVPDRVKDELITFLGYSLVLTYFDGDTPAQQGSVFELREHQEEALVNLVKMREKGKTIALVQGATGSGKSAIGILDAKHVGKRVLFLAHTKELVEQGAANFESLWPEVSVGRFYESFHDTASFVVCGSIQSIIRNLNQFKPDDFDYLIIDECHHASAKSYTKILTYFRPKFTLGLTATPERADGADLLEVFQTVAHKLDIKDAVETGVLCPVRCIRVKTNIDMSDVRINGFKYNALDLEQTIMIPVRNRLIVDNHMEYAQGKYTVIFCTSVNHAETIAILLQERGIKAEAVSGGTNAAVRKQILKQYAVKEFQVLCACDLLNEGWDSPITEVLFMARPTMSKIIYTQQLGSGMRTHEGKEFLMVFDFVDNANMFNCPYSLHRLLNISEYVPGGMVLGTKHSMQWNRDMFKKGEKPAVLVDFPISVMDYEVIDIFNWQDKASQMYSEMKLTRYVTAQEETISKYIREGKIVPNMDVPISEHRTLHFFNKERVREYCQKFGWTEITPGNRKQLFLDFCSEMQMSYSYKLVFLISFLSNMNEHGAAMLSDVAESFAWYYEDRIKKGLSAEKKNCIFTKGDYTQKDVERLILSMPFKRFEGMGYMRHSKYLGVIQIDKSITKTLDDDDVSTILTYCTDALERYWG